MCAHHVCGVGLYVVTKTTAVVGQASLVAGMNYSWQGERTQQANEQLHRTLSRETQI